MYINHKQLACMTFSEKQEYSYSLKRCRKRHTEQKVIHIGIYKLHNKTGKLKGVYSAKYTN